MDSEQLQFLFSLFSFIGLIAVLFYLIVEKAKSEEQLDRVDMLELKLNSLQSYLYELDEQLEHLKVSKNDNIKEKIIEMYKAGKESMVIENALNVPKAKIEMVIKFHELKEKNEKK